MNDRARQANERARRALDRVAEQEPLWRAERELRDDAEQWTTPKRGVIYKTFETPTPQVTTMDPESQKRWDAWFDARFDAAIDAWAQETLIDSVAEALVHDRRAMREFVGEQIKELRDELDADKVLQWPRKANVA